MNDRRFSSLQRWRYRALPSNPDWASSWDRGLLDKLVPSPAQRSLKHRLGLLAAGDSAFVPLAAPRVRRGEVVGPPDFVGIGVQRAGTTWWFDLMARQPGIFHRSSLQLFKERHYLSHIALVDVDDRQLQHGYAQWFPRRPGTITGEWTPDYFAYAWVPELLKVAAPEARLLLILRDPIERLISGAALVERLNRGALPPAYVLQDAFLRGLYAAQLGQWLKHFPIEQFLVLQYERCVQDTQEELMRTLRFLGVDDVVSEMPERNTVNATPGTKPVLPSEVRQRLFRLYEEDVGELLRLVPSLDVSVWPNFATLGSS